MEVISFYESVRQQHWQDKIAESDWSAGKYLHQLLGSGRFFDTLGKESWLLLLTEGDELVSFCTFAEKDEIVSTEYYPWIGFVYTFPAYRGHGYIGRLFRKIECIAGEKNIHNVYLSTDHIGLYEKYGFEYIKDMESIYGGMSRVYTKRIE